jgi:hypothetical protein
LNNTSPRYAQFNTLTVTGRIFHAEIAYKDGSEFVAVSVISTASNDGADIEYKFNNSNGLMNLFKKGYFCEGRQVTITGHIKDVSAYWITNAGEIRPLKRPAIQLSGVNVLDGGLGPMPNAERQAQRLAANTVITQVGTPNVDETPSMEPVAVEEEELVAPY